MKQRTRTLGAIGATVVTAGLVLGLGFGGSSAAGNTLMGSTTMGSMGSMGSTDMSAMHSMMHQMMKGTVDDDVLAACDEAHATMAESMTTMPEQGRTQHEAHHGGAGS